MRDVDGTEVKRIDHSDLIGHLPPYSYTGFYLYGADISEGYLTDNEQRRNFCGY